LLRGWNFKESRNLFACKAGVEQIGLRAEKKLSSTSVMFKCY